MNYTFNAKEHVHLFNGEPLYGTSTIIKDVMPPFLAKWGAQCAVDFLKDNPGQYEKAVSAWSKVRDTAATKGTDMHAVLEGYVNTCITENKGIPLAHSVNETPQLSAFVDWSMISVKQFVFAEKYTYSKELWTGGIVDCFAEMSDGAFAVIDFKSSKEAYFNQFAQVAGYALQLTETGYGNEDGSNWATLTTPITRLIIVPFGAPKLAPHSIGNVEGYMKVFRHLVGVYVFLRSFNSKK